MNKHIVRHEDGTASTRNSQNRTYTHAIEVGPYNAEMVIANNIAHAEARLAKAEAELAAFIASGKKITIKDRNLRLSNVVDPDLGYTGEPTYHNFELRVAGSSNSSRHCNSKGESTRGYPEVTVVSFEQNCAEIEAGLIESVESAKFNLAYNRAQTPADIDTKGWDIVTWCGRLDLAQKQLEKWSAIYAATGNVVRIVETATP
jgi:hypothetical protein